ncbi:hypothetical protein ACSSS7_004628 [Eimeria intestinalis]
MTISALVASKYAPTRGSQSESRPRTRSKGSDPPAGSWWPGGGEGSHADLDGDALRHHLLPGLDLPVPPLETSQPAGPDAARACLSPLYSHDFLPSVLADNKGERVYAEAAQPCTKQDLQKAVAALVALNRAQSESIQVLRHQWSLRHFELGGKINTLETSLKLHHSLLVRIIENVRSGRLHAVNWSELEMALPRLRQESSEPSCSDTRDSQARDHEATCEANDVLSDAPANWTSKLFDWCTRVDCLPIAEVALSEPLASSCAPDKGSVSSETGEGDVEPLSTASDEEEQIQLEGQGLRMHVMGAGGAALSAAAERDGGRFIDFVRSASLRQEAWVETFSSFAATAVPIADLTRATSLMLGLLDEAVTLPDTDMLLLVAQSLEPVGNECQKVGLRVLCLLERAVAARCNVRSGSLRRGALLEVHAFEPFCAVVQPEEEESSGGSTKGKLLIIPICSLQKIKLERGAPSPEAGSASARSGDSASHSGAGDGAQASGHTSMAANAAAALEGSSRTSSRRETSAGGGGSDRPAVADRTAELAEPTMDGGKRRKTCDVEEKNEARKGERRSEAGEPTSVRREPGEPQMETSGQHRQQRPRGEFQGRERGSASTQQSGSRGSSAANNQCGSSPQVDFGSTKGSTARDSEAGRSSSSEAGAHSIATSPPAHGSRQQSGASSESGAAGSRPSRVAAASGAAACRAPAAAAESSSRRTATSTSVRCSAQAAQQQLEDARQHLPRVRGVLPKQLRQQLPAFDCEECASFYGMVGGGPPLERGTCKHKKLESVKQGNCIRESKGQQARHGGSSAAGDPRMWSRHRQFAAPPSTPPGYWDL